MITAFLILLAATTLVTFYARGKDPASISRAAAFTRQECLRLAVRLPFALFAASCLADLIPDRVIAAVMGPESGLTGIVAASLLGGLLPGGPIVSFPLAVMFAREGAGGAQVVALISGWSVYAIHRTIAYELPIMGARFAAVRMLASLIVPVAAAVGAGMVAGALGLSLKLP